MNRDEARQFLAALFEPGDLIEFRPIETWTDASGKRCSKSTPSLWARAGNVNGELATLEALNARRFNVFFGVCPRAARVSGKAGVRLVRALWSDLDNCTPDEATERCRDARLPEPSIVVNSGHGTHLYWTLGEPFELHTDADRAKVEQVVKEIAGLIGGDHVSDTSRLLRVPGTLNVKNSRNGRPAAPCSLVQSDHDLACESLDHAISMLPEASQFRVDVTGDSGDGDKTPPDDPKDGGSVAVAGIPPAVRDRIRAKLQQPASDRSARDWAVVRGLADEGYTPDAIHDVVDDLSKFQGRPDYATRTIEKAIEQRVERPAPQPWVPFPTGLLPNVLHRFIEATAAAIGCDESMVALPTLAAVAASIGTSRRLRLKSTWRESPILWTGVVARSGTLKSPAHDLATRALHRIQKKAAEAYDVAMARRQVELAKHKLALSRWKKDHSDDPSPPDPPKEPEPPKLRRYVVSDITVEALGVILEQNRRGVLLVRDELSAWLKSFNQYKSRGSDEAAWLELHRAGPLVIDRKTGPRPVQIIPRAAVSICGTIQPGILDHALTDEHFDSGMAARLLLARPPQRRKVWSDRVPSPAVVDDYERLILRLTELEHRENEPISLEFTPNAKPVWTTWYDAHAERIDAAETDRRAAALSKIEGYAARFALIFALCEDSAAVQVETCHIENGCKLADWFADEAARIYSMMEAAAGEVDRTLLDFIKQRGGQVTVRALKHGPRKYRSGDAAEEGLQALVDRGLARWKNPAPGCRGGRPQRICELVTVAPEPKPPVGGSE